VHKRIISAVKRVRFVSDKMSYIQISILKYGRMTFLNLHLGITVYTKSLIVMELE
jgi:hypothetical protein